MYIAMRKTCPPKDEIALAGLELRGESCGGTPRTLGCKEKERPLLRQKLTIDIYTSSLISWILAKAGVAFMLHAQVLNRQNASLFCRLKIGNSINRYSLALFDNK